MLADEIGSWHLDVSIDVVITSLLSLFQRLTGKQPRYKVKCKSFKVYNIINVYAMNASICH